MKDFQEIAEKCLKGELSGKFILRNGSKIHSTSLSRLGNKYLPYKLHGFSYYSNGNYLSSNISNMDIVNFIPDMEERNVKLTLEKAKEWYEKGGELKEVALQAYTEEELKVCRPESWAEYVHQMIGKKAYYISTNSNINCFDYDLIDPECDRNILPTQELAEAFRAYMQLVSLRKAWVGEWEPDWSDMSQLKYCICHDCSNTVLRANRNTYRSLSFPTESMAKEFLNCFKNLLEEAKGLY